jgi:hypothetical protein
MRRQCSFASPVLWVPDAKSAVGCSGDETVVTQIQKTNKRSVSFKIEETSPGLKIPDFDEVIHRAGYTTSSAMVEDYAVNLLRMPLQTVDQVPGRYLPHADRAVVGT